MATRHQTIDRFLNRAQVALDNARQTPEILAAVSIFGYDAVRLGEGRALLDAALSRHAAQKRAYGEQYAATEALNRVRQAADEVYRVHRRLTRLVLDDDATRRRALGLSEPKQQSLAGWLGQAVMFYTTALSDAETLSALARYNVMRADLEEGQALLEQVAELHSVQERAKYAAQQATKDRDAALRALKVWLSEFRVVAKIALADRPQQLEALQFGVVP